MKKIILTITFLLIGVMLLPNKTLASSRAVGGPEFGKIYITVDSWDKYSTPIGNEKTNFWIDGQIEFDLENLEKLRKTLVERNYLKDLPIIFYYYDLEVGQDSKEYDRKIALKHSEGQNCFHTYAWESYTELGQDCYRVEMHSTQKPYFPDFVRAIFKLTDLSETNQEIKFDSFHYDVNFKNDFDIGTKSLYEFFDSGEVEKVKYEYQSNQPSLINPIVIIGVGILAIAAVGVSFCGGFLIGRKSKAKIKKKK